jgi:hypothetical protein
MILCVITRGGKHIRCHFYPLVGLTSIVSYHSRRELGRPNFRRLWYGPTKVRELTSVSRQGRMEVTVRWGEGVVLTSVRIDEN